MTTGLQSPSGTLRDGRRAGLRAVTVADAGELRMERAAAAPTVRSGVGVLSRWRRRRW